MFAGWRVAAPVVPAFPDRSLEAVGLASGNVARKKVFEGDVAGDERREEKPLDERFWHAVQALQRSPWSSVPGRAPLGRLGVAAVSPPVLAGVRAAVRKVAVDIGDDVGGLVVGETKLAVRRLL